MSVRAATMDRGAAPVGTSWLAKAAVGALLVGTVSVMLAGVVVRPAAPVAASWTDVSVGHNGTLWELARMHPVPGLSVSETVDLIQSENGLNTSTVYTGQSLRVPADAIPVTTVASR